MPRSSAAVRLPDEPMPETSPLACCDALGRTSAETCRQHERLSRLTALGVSANELGAAHAMVDTIDLALAESVKEFEKSCAKVHEAEIGDIRSGANAMWLAAREYLRRASIAEKASRQLQTHDADVLGDLHFEYELEASALLGLKQATANYQKLRPESK